MRSWRRLALALLVTLPFVGGAKADTLADVRQRGLLKCGVSDRAPGFSLVDDKGKRQGFEIDYCDALAAAIFGAPKVEYVPLLPRDAFATLKNGGVDIFADRAAWTFLRDTTVGLSYAAIYFYEGQGFMVKKSLGVKSAKELQGASFCTTQGTTYELNLADWARTQNIEYKVLTFADFDEALRAYESGRCDVWTADVGNLATRGIALRDRGEHMILPEIISREPLGPMIREGDERWRKIAFWVENARIAAEEFGITSANVDEMKASSKNPEIQRLLGVNGEFGVKLGLSNDWAADAIKAAGNYAQSWERNLGPATPLNLPRGQSALVKNGGLLYPLPFR
jgi:general L-amino acid transport system substrate-binding protein